MTVLDSFFVRKDVKGWDGGRTCLNYSNHDIMWGGYSTVMEGLLRHYVDCSCCRSNCHKHLLQLLKSLIITTVLKSNRLLSVLFTQNYSFEYLWWMIGMCNTFLKRMWKETIRVQRERPSLILAGRGVNSAVCVCVLPNSFLKCLLNHLDLSVEWKPKKLPGSVFCW